MKLFVCGDNHCPIDMRKLNSKNWPEKKELTKDDILVVLGDWGVIWKGEMDNGEAYWIKWFNEQKFTTIIVPGNHENWHRLREYPLMTKFGGRVRQISDSIFMAERPSVLNIEGKSIFCFGGAESHDKAWRTEGLSWWPEEVQSHAEQELALDILAEHDYKFDYVFTHTCPTEVVEMIISHKANCSTSRFLSHIRANIEYDEWHFGHMHEDVTLGKFHCHYNGKPEQII